MIRKMIFECALCGKILYWAEWDEEKGKEEEENCFNEKETENKVFSLISLQFVWNFATHRERKKKFEFKSRKPEGYFQAAQKQTREGENLNFLIVLYNSTIE